MRFLRCVLYMILLSPVHCMFTIHSILLDLIGPTNSFCLCTSLIYLSEVIPSAQLIYVKVRGKILQPYELPAKIVVFGYLENK